LSVGSGLKSFGHAFSFHSGLSTVMARHQGCGRILMYHGVAAEDTQALSAEWLYLARNFKIASLQTMLDRLTNPSIPLTNEIALTFDDGLRNNLTVVYPILRELHLPATFFVCPGLVDSGDWLWNNEARCRLQTLTVEDLTELRMKLLTPGSSVDGIVEWMKSLRLPQRNHAEAIIRHATPDFEPTASQKAFFDMMNWEDLLSLDPGLITVGSHTLTHPILPMLNAQEIELELVESRRCLEQRLQRTVDLFCYPNGSYDERAYQAVKNIYRAAVATESGMVGGRQKVDLHRLPRIPSAENAALTAWRLHRPEA
jgi:peptidoglycan/xylan/chitin deacetylase (PgdA/CDA1 family)